MNGPGPRIDVLALRKVIDALDYALRKIVRLRTSIAAQIVVRKNETTNKARERQILEKCESRAERTIYPILFEAAKARVLDTDDGRGAKS